MSETRETPASDERDPNGIYLSMVRKRDACAGAVEKPVAVEEPKPVVKEPVVTEPVETPVIEPKETSRTFFRKFSNFLK